MSKVEAGWAALGLFAAAAGVMTAVHAIRKRSARAVSFLLRFSCSPHSRSQSASLPVIRDLSAFEAKKAKIIKVCVVGCSGRFQRSRFQWRGCFFQSGGKQLVVIMDFDRTISTNKVGFSPFPV